MPSYAGELWAWGVSLSGEELKAVETKRSHLDQDMPGFGTGRQVGGGVDQF